MTKTLSHVHRFEPAEGSERLMLLLHGTGGNEHDLMEIGRAVAPGAALLSPRGRSMDEGVPRFFRRLREGVFDLDDLHAKTGELAEFVAAAKREYGVEGRPVTALGYSNGANMAASLLLAGTGLLDSAILLRPMVPFEPDPLPDLSGARVLLASGENDGICRPEESTRLAGLLRGAGASVEQYWAPVGHGLTQGDIVAAQQFFAGLVGARKG